MRFLPNPMRFIPNFKGFDFFPHDLRLPFMRYKGLCLGLSIVGIVLSLLIIGVRGFNYGVDFKGGSMLEVQSKSGPADIAALREKLGKLGLGAVQIQGFGAPSDVLIRVEEQPGGEAAQQAALAKVMTALADQYTQRRIEVVGPAVSSELRLTGIIAVVVGMLAISAYVWFRFEWQFAVGVVLSLAHDVLLVAGIFSLFHLEFDLSIVAALLTILGYSVNDSVVVSDRIRENLRKYKRMDLDELLNLSINETLSRTILTGVTAIVVLISLYIFGGEVIRNFNLAMLLGVVIGTYSSIFIAAPLLGYLGVKREWVGDSGQAGRRQRCPQGPAREHGLQMKEPSARYPGRAPIDAYGNGGFRFADMSHRGSILCLPSGIYAWPPSSVADLGPEAFAPALAERGALGLLLLGTGPSQHMPAADVRRAFAEAGVTLEAMSTGAACRTYNVLLAEARPVGAALLAVE